MLVLLMMSIIFSIGAGLLLGAFAAVVVLFTRWLNRRPRYIDQEDSHGRPVR